MGNCMKVKKYSIENGEGIRTSVFFSGCEFKCKGCFNSVAWDFNKGQFIDYNFYEKEIKTTINEHITGISILGGEPLHFKNLASTAALVRWFKNDFPDKSIWLWTGYTWEELIVQLEGAKIRAGSIQEILDKIDILVDGQFIEEQRDLTLKWRGSKNQRVINVKKTMKQKEIVKYCE